MTMIDVRQFVSNYTPADEPNIRFAWNGKHGDLFADDNYAFRKKVLDEVLKNLDSVDLALIRDLVRAETEFSKEAWAIDLRVSRLAQVLLTRGGVAYVEDYLIGRKQSFDAYLACATVTISCEQAKLLLDAIAERLEQERDESKKEVLQFGKEIFERWVDNTRQKEDK